MTFCRTCRGSLRPRGQDSGQGGGLAPLAVAAPAAVEVAQPAEEPALEGGLVGAELEDGKKNEPGRHDAGYGRTFHVRVLTKGDPVRHIGKNAGSGWVFVGFGQEASRRPGRHARKPPGPGGQRGTEHEFHKLQSNSTYFL